MRFDSRITHLYSVDQLQAFVRQDTTRLTALTTMLIHKNNIPAIELENIASNLDTLRNELAKRPIDT